MSKAMSYQVPKTLPEVYNNINLSEPLQYNDPRYVSTENGRGKFNFSKLYKCFSVDYIENKFIEGKPPKNKYAIFCGHRGCGKSTELMRLKEKLDVDNLFFVVFLSSSTELDSNNIQTTDIFMALAKKLFEKLNESKIKIDKRYLDNLYVWFDKKVVSQEIKNEINSEFKTGASVEVGIPYFIKLFTTVTSALKFNSTYKEELRKEIKNSFSDFAEAFNLLLAAVCDNIQKVNRKELLFIIDDLEKLSSEDSTNIFIKNVDQLKQINSNFIYTASIDQMSRTGSYQSSFVTETFPMIKIFEQDKTKNETGFSIMRELIYKRADKSLFTSEAVIDKIIEFSGGNPRDLLHLIISAYFATTKNIFDEESINDAIHTLATDKRRFLEESDYKILFDNDNSNEYNPTDRIRFLLNNLALLEYNSFWWRSHPLVRTLPGYRKLEEAKKRSARKKKS